MTRHETMVAEALEDACLTLEQLASACAVEPEWIVTRVEAGFFPTVPERRGDWRFTSMALTRARRMRQVERDFEAVPELAALVADMLEEMDRMRARLRLGGME